MPLHRNKSRSAVDGDSPNLSKASSFSSSELPPSRSNSVSKTSNQANGSARSKSTFAPSPKEAPKKLSKSTFYTEPEKVYPSSCVHTPQPLQMNPKFLAASCLDLTEEVTLSKSLSIPNLSSKATTKKKSSKVDRYATVRSTSSQKLFRSMRAKSSSRIEISDSASDDLSDISIGKSRFILNIDVPNHDPQDSSYYSYDLFETRSLTSWALERKCDECLKTISSYKGDIYRDIGLNGAVISLVGCDVSLHVPRRLPPDLSQPCSTCLSSSNVKLTRHRYTSAVASQMHGEKKHGKKFSNIVSRSSSDRLKEAGPRLIDFECPAVRDEIVDGRILVGLEDPPNSHLLSNNFETKKNTHQKSLRFAIAGPAVRLDLKDKRIIQHGAIVQLPVNVSLVEPESQRLSNNRISKSNQFCDVTCLQSTSHDGTYREVKSCYVCGDTLQVTIDVGQLPSPTQSGKNNCEIYIVPVVKQAFPGLGSVWEGIKTKTYHVGIYGSRYSYEKNTYCVSLSSSGFNPPFFKLRYKNSQQLTLRLLGSYVIRTHQVQGYKMNVRTSTAAYALTMDLSNCEFSQSELLTEARIVRIFALKRNPNFQRAEKKRPKFIVELTGLSDEILLKMKCECPPFKGNDFPPELSPAIVSRLAMSMETSPRAMVESKLKDITFQWILGMLEDRSRFQTQLEIPFSKRRVFGIKFAYALKTFPSKKKNLSLPSYFLRYSSDDYLPVLSKYSLLMTDVNGSKREWWLCYHKHRLGLVRTSTVKILEYNDFASWNEARVEVGKLVEAITDPVLTLESESVPIEEKLLSQLQNWTLFSAAMRFGETFAETSISTEQDDELRRKKKSFYMRKLVDYRTSSGKMNQFHYDVIKALLYSEHYDLATDLVADLALLNTAMNVEEANWLQLVGLLVGRAAEDDYQNFFDLQPFSEERWKPIHDYLCKWRERFSDNHKGVLFALHQAVGHLSSETALHLQQILTDLVILVRTFETLCQFDTNL